MPIDCDSTHTPRTISTIPISTYRHCDILVVILSISAVIKVTAAERFASTSAISYILLIYNKPNKTTA